MLLIAYVFDKSIVSKTVYTKREVCREGFVGSFSITIFPDECDLFIPRVRGYRVKTYTHLMYYIISAK